MRNLARRLALTTTLALLLCSFGPPPTAEPDSRIIVYYFHGKRRCATCHKIETYSKAAVEKLFPGQLESGRIEWLTVDTSKSENAHFVDEYELFTQSLVLVEEREGEQVRWKNLQRVWQLVHDRPAFEAYVHDSVWDWLQEN
jgi:hypothetical protein